MAEDFSYVVRTTFVELSVFEAFVDYLATRHVADVLAAGAGAAELVRLDGSLTVEVRYRFASREAFERYDREEGPGLRERTLGFLAEKGVTRGDGVTFTRSTGAFLPFSAAR